MQKYAFYLLSAFTVWAAAWNACAAGIVTYTLGNKVFYIATKAGSTPFNVTAKLNQTLAGGGDGQLNISPNGRWLVMNAERLDPECTGWPCVIVMNKALTNVQALKINGNPLHTDGFNAIASTGRLVVFAAHQDGSTHVQDLWKTVKDASGQWRTPVLLTKASPYLYNHQPALSADASRVLFDCGNVPYGGAGTAICEVDIRGRNFRTVIKPQNIPPGYPAGSALHHPDYADGAIVFEADWGGERIWRLASGSKTAATVNKNLSNDNSPCVLPSGEIISLYLSRPGGSGLHELKLMSAFGAYRMLLINRDIADIGIGCGSY
ncbi:MAG: TolB family protein [Gammaproteobacteria bacterium]